MVPNGKIFDNSLEKGRPYDVRVGAGQVCHALTRTVRVSSHRRFCFAGYLLRCPDRGIYVCDAQTSKIITCSVVPIWRTPVQALITLLGRVDKNSYAHCCIMLVKPDMKFHAMFKLAGLSVQVIPGLDEGMKSMKVGGIRRLYIPGMLN